MNRSPFRTAVLLAAALVACGGSGGEGDEGARGANGAAEQPAPHPVLGGPSAEFAALLGAARPGEDPNAGQRYRPCGDVDQFVVFFDEDKAVEITRRSCTGTLAAANAMAEAQSYFPPDADPPAGEPFTLQEGPALRYHSPTLATAVRRVWFHDCNGRRVDPGSFALVVREDGWTLATGTCPNG